MKIFVTGKRVRRQSCRSSVPRRSGTVAVVRCAARYDPASGVYQRDGTLNSQGSFFCAVFQPGKLRVTSHLLWSG
jgi:hypothetical protein